MPSHPLLVRRALVIVPIACSVLLGAGCSSSTTERDSTIEGQDDTAEVGTTQIPDRFPTDFPRYPGAKTMLAYVESDGKSGSLMETTSDPREVAMDRVEQLMSAQGFTKSNTLSAQDLTIANFQKANIRFQINFASRDGITTIQSVRAEQ